jgi:hypothetical protein
MKLNFWQWLGIIIVVVALVFIMRRETGDRGGPNRPPNPAPEFTPGEGVEKPAAQPTTAPAAIDPTTGPAAP